MVPKEYLSYLITEPDATKQEILIASLADFGFDGFEQTDTTVSANGLADNINIPEVEAFLHQQQVPFTTETIQEQNWNKQWEQSFQPIVVDHFCAVRAAFHQPVADVQYEIIITPKMSFGTGHHATTYMMLQAMQQKDMKDKTVIDFGTGTGILAILAEKMGAKKVLAIDNDDWCIENGTENIGANNCSHIELLKASNVENTEQADIILANINKHVILANFPSMKAKLNIDGLLLISGILQADEQDIMQAAQENKFLRKHITERNGWLCICFRLN